jgi:hypothetical protein
MPNQKIQYKYPFFFVAAVAEGFVSAMKVKEDNANEEKGKEGLSAVIMLLKVLNDCNTTRSLLLK